MRSAYTKLVSGYLFPLHERLKGHDTVAVREALEESQWWSRDMLEALQLRRLRELLVTAQKNVPYYTNLFGQTGFCPSALRDVRDLAQLPTLDKQTIRSNVESLKSRRGNRLVRLNTGGSSGEPLVFFVGKERVSHDVAAKWRATRWFGVDIGDPEIVLWGSPIELGAQDRLRRWRDILFRSQLLPAFAMNDAKLEEFLKVLRTWRPRMLFGYPSALARIAEYGEKAGVALNDLGIRVAFVTSERLYEHQRAAIQRAFGCVVANGYGGRDAGFVAHECPQGGMHVTAEDIVVEVLDPDGNPVSAGDAGEIVVTHLATGDFPLIRYRTGDVASFDTAPCPCGRGLPALREIQGRSTDFVVATDGTVLHGLALIYVLRDLPSVRAFKIVQHRVDLVSVDLVAAPDFGESAEATIIEGFRKRLGATVAVELRRVEAIAPERSGKYRYVVSHVLPPSASIAEAKHA